MLRAISTDTTHRRPATQAHRARPAAGAAGRKMSDNVRLECDIIQEETKAAYIRFITGLMYRMKMDGIERMLDAALEQEINQGGGIKMTNENKFTEEEIAVLVKFYDKLKAVCKKAPEVEGFGGKVWDCRKCKMMIFCDAAPMQFDEREIRQMVKTLESDR